MDKSKVYYKSLCGCIFTRDQLVRGDSTQNYRLVCPYHREFIETKFGYCQECGVKIEYTNPKLAVAKKCVSCNPSLTRKKRHRGKQRRKRVERVAKADVMQSLMDCCDCSFRPLCSEMYIDAPYLPCHTCGDYKASDPLADLSYNVDLAEIDAFLQSEDPAVRAEGLSTWGDFFEKRQKVLAKTLQNG